MSDQREQRSRSQRVVREFQKRRRTLRRWEYPGATYHVRATVLRERPESLLEPEIAEIVTKSLHHDDGRRYVLHCYVLMPDHFHAILRPLARDDGFIPLPEIMHGIKSTTAHRVNRLSGRTGGFWLDQSYTRIIRCVGEYEETWHYIRCNPIKAGFVDRPEEWKWWWRRVA